MEFGLGSTHQISQLVGLEYPEHVENWSKKVSASALNFDPAPKRKGQLFLLTPVGYGTINNCPDLDQCPMLHESCARKTWTSVLRPFQPANSEKIFKKTPGHASWKVDRNFPGYGSIGAVLKLGYRQN